jgi:cyclohexa-1,5-dienecarbonyl-CoA hydratase
VTPAVRTELLEGGGVARVVFEADKGNVLTSDLLRELDRSLAARGDDPALRLLLVEGAGKHFSFGASVEEHRAEHVAAMLAHFHALVRRLASYPVPAAAVVRGRCLGGGFELALACNFVFAAEGAIFACPEIKLGVLPPVLAAIGPLRLGTPWTERLLLTGGDLDAQAARQLGFVTEIAGPGADPLDVALGWYRAHLAGLSGFSLRRALDALRLGSGIGSRLDGTLTTLERLYLYRIASSHDGNEGIAAFLEKRPPVWTHD